MNPDQINLESISKLFEYEKYSRQIDEIDDLKQLRDFAKCYMKLYLKQQEVVLELGIE
jgi:hypothetical protein